MMASLDYLDLHQEVAIFVLVAALSCRPGERWRCRLIADYRSDDLAKELLAGGGVAIEPFLKESSMRFEKRDTFVDEGEPSAGCLLLAHPTLRDPNFRRTVVLLTMHDAVEGSLGVVMNRSLGKTLGEHDSGFSGSPLAGLPLFGGGPVAPDRLVLAAWKWRPGEGTFQLHFGIDEAGAEGLMRDDSGYKICGFLGHASWGGGQLKAEIEEDAWVLSRWLPGLEEKVGVEVWRSILCHESPIMRLLVDAPEDPSLN